MRLFPSLLVCLAGALAALGQHQVPWGKSPFVLTVEPAAVEADHIDVRIALAFPPKHVVYADSFKVSALGRLAKLESLRLPAPDKKPDLLDRAKLIEVYAHPFESLWRLAGPRDNAYLQVAYRGCDDKVCFMPVQRTFRFDAAKRIFVESEEPAPESEPASAPPWTAGLQVKTAGGYLSAREFLAFLDEAEGVARPAGAEGAGLAGFLRDPVAFFHARGMLLTLLLVLAGGVLLNLTPCVLPMIPINLAIIGAGAGTRGRGFVLGLAYGVGMVLVYGGLGWGILRSGLFFGALQASPWFSLSVGVVFVLLALALFDVFVIDFARLAGAGGGSPRQGVIAALSAGGLSALLAGACVAPVVLAVLLLAGSLYAGGARGAQFLPFVLGLGMALPWPFAGMGLSVLPRPGVWMVRVKQAFGVFLVLLAAYYLHLAWGGFAPAGEAREGSIAAGDRAAWEAKVAQARGEGKPLFVDFWATWCKNCSAMERSTFRDERVKARLAKYVVVKVQAEKPEQSPAKEMLEAFDVRGLPGFAVLK